MNSTCVFYMTCWVEPSAALRKKQKYPRLIKVYGRLGIPAIDMLYTEQDELENALQEWCDEIQKEYKGSRIVNAEFIPYEEFEKAVEEEKEQNRKHGPIGDPPEPSDKKAKSAKSYVYLKATGLYPNLAGQRGTGKDGPEVPFRVEVSKNLHTMSPSELAHSLVYAREQVAKKIKEHFSDGRRAKQIVVIGKKEYEELLDSYVKMLTTLPSKKEEET